MQFGTLLLAVYIILQCINDKDKEYVSYHV